MRKLAEITSVFILASTFYPALIKPFYQVSAQIEESEEERRNRELKEKSKTLKDLILSKEKGDQLVIEDETGKSVLTRFIYENEGYVVCASNSQQEDALAILIHSLWHGRGHYVGLLAEKGALTSGYSAFYIASEDAKLIPEDIAGCLSKHKIIQTRKYNSERKETYNEKDYFLAEFDKTLDELLEFYESD